MHDAMAEECVEQGAGRRPNGETVVALFQLLCMTVMAITGVGLYVLACYAFARGEDFFLMFAMASVSLFSVHVLSYWHKLVWS